jgi:hypothetical protein
VGVLAVHVGAVDRDRLHDHQKYPEHTHCAKFEPGNIPTKLSLTVFAGGRLRLVLQNWKTGNFGTSRDRGGWLCGAIVLSWHVRSPASGGRSRWPRPADIPADTPAGVFAVKEQSGASAVEIVKCVGSGWQQPYMSLRPSRRPQPSLCSRGWGLNPSEDSSPDARASR